MSHRNARLTFHGRLMLVERVLDDERPVAHVAKEMGVSRQCGHKWVARYRAEGEAGLHDRSSRPHHSPTRTPADVEDRYLVGERSLHVLGSQPQVRWPSPPSTGGAASDG